MENINLSVQELLIPQTGQDDNISSRVSYLYPQDKHFNLYPL